MPIPRVELVVEDHLVAELGDGYVAAKLLPGGRQVVFLCERDGSRGFLVASRNLFPILSRLNPASSFDSPSGKKFGDIRRTPVLAGSSVNQRKEGSVVLK